jgi:Tfp pilus assembly protein PilV
MALNYAKQRGFSLIVILVAILIIAVIAFGLMNKKGQVEQNKEIKDKATEDLKVINQNLEKNNQQIQDSLENK